MIAVALGVAGAAFGATTPHDAPQVDFRGIPFGVNEHEFLTKQQHFACHDAAESREEKYADRLCIADVHNSDTMTYASTRASFIEASFISDRLVLVTVDFDAASTLDATRIQNALIKVLIAKFGLPIQKSEADRLTEAMKPQLMHVTEWKFPSGNILAVTFTGRAPSFHVALSAPNFSDLVRQHQAPMMKERSKAM
jgi:hypothetical protein